jgi:hypothetical protein
LFFSFLCAVASCFAWAESVGCGCRDLGQKDEKNRDNTYWNIFDITDKFVLLLLHSLVVKLAFAIRTLTRLKAW